MKQILLFIFPACLIIGCKSPNREIIDSFEEVNKSLEQSNDFKSWSIDKLYQPIKSKTERNSKYLSLSDTIYHVAKDAISFLEKQKNNLMSLDSVGENLDVATAVMTESPVGDTVEKLLGEVYRSANEVLVDKSKKKSIDSVMSSISELKKRKNWKHDYFCRIPTIAAITILSKFQNDCEKSATITLSDIYEHMNN